MNIDRDKLNEISPEKCMRLIFMPIALGFVAAHVGYELSAGPQARPGFLYLAAWMILACIASESWEFLSWKRRVRNDQRPMQDLRELIRASYSVEDLTKIARSSEEDADLAASLVHMLIPPAEAAAADRAFGN